MSTLSRHDLPPLDLLRSFEAAARLLSFTQAAQELFLTQSAVSRQIQQVEESLGVQLFERRHRALALTPAGTAFHKVVLDCLERLRDATLSLRAQSARQSQVRQVAITTTPGFASLWLIPRLARFTASHPQVEVRIAASLELQDLDRQRFDLAARLVSLEHMAAEGGAIPLFSEQVMPVCSPALLHDRTHPLKTPADLAHHTLLTLQYDSHTPAPPMALMEDWGPWLNLMGLAEVQGVNTLRFTGFADAVAAAVAGQGVLMGRFPLLAPQLASGQLVAPFKGRAASQRGYCLVLSRQGQRNADALAFAEWMQKEAKN